MSALRLLLPFLLLPALAGCAVPPSGPRLLTAAEIAQASRGSEAGPDNAFLLARAARLSARAAELRRTSIDQHERRRMQERAARLVAS